MTYRYYKVNGHPLELAGCHACGELRTPALRKQLINKQVICMNCSVKKRVIGKCYLCLNSNIPMEVHHIAGRGHPETMRICLNCHSVVSAWQIAHPEQKADFYYGVIALIATFFDNLIINY